MVGGRDGSCTSASTSHSRRALATSPTVSMELCSKGEKVQSPPLHTHTLSLSLSHTHTHTHNTHTQAKGVGHYITVVSIKVELERADIHDCTCSMYIHIITCSIPSVAAVP